MRYHPLTIPFRIYQLVKNSLFIGLILFVFNKDSEFWLMEYGRYAFVILVLWRLIYIVAAWFVEKYEWKDRTFHVYKGVFTKHTSTIPFSRIQNVTRKTTVFHKLVGLTSLTFETAMDGEDDSIHFEVLTKKHADYLIELVQPGKENTPIEESEPEVDPSIGEQEIVGEEQGPAQEKSRTIHFTPQRKDLVKASFTSLSFLAIIPIVFGVIDYVEPLLPDQDEVEGIFNVLLHSTWLLFGLIVVAIIIAVVFGFVRTFIRFGKYEISSDTRYIYIDRGVLDESYFAIEKRKVQGLEINQTFIKRLFGLAEVKLISSASPNNSDGSVNVNSLYPFLPIHEAYQLIEELLPTYKVHTELERLPRKSLWVKLLRPSWVWMIATIGLFYFKPEPFNIEQAWWILSIVLLILVVLNRILDYIHTRYIVTTDQIQWWHGGLTSRMFITKRRNMIEMSYSQNRLQRMFHVASITTMNRSVPAHIETIQDLPLPYALGMENWYLKRHEDVQVEG
ncbi:putative membrane protein [Oceanobacillus limi]|uniref:Putative membrane protein n=1 Tax=Oceanobacillus limi TaxID=930131 RepID=A0A1I0EPZ3_9BACI|nr:PH domain-containing protein [Oceanobacillus limi]SET47361.1 putative membrane protein [Oceanobacillus limi]